MVVHLMKFKNCNLYNIYILGLLPKRRKYPFQILSISYQR